MSPFLKRFLYIFLYLNIYTCFFFGIKAQELTLSIKTEKPISEGIIDSLQMKTSFKDFNSLKNEADTLYLKFQRMGFIESELIELKKENDSSYLADFSLGKKFSYLKVFYSNEDFTKKELQQISSEVDEIYFILPFENIPLSLKKLTAFRNQKGNAFARVKLSDFEKDENENLSATLFIDNGNVRTVDSIVVKG